MTPHISKPSIIWINETDSTNRELRKRLPTSDNLSIIAARTQSAGRGQGDHTWFSSPSTNLTFSVLYRFDAPAICHIKASDIIVITEITTLALRDYLSSKGICARIKWPNDIWVGDRKICGILIENILDGEHIAISIVGIGLNVNEKSWPYAIPNPVSMKELTGLDYDLEKELEALGDYLSKRYSQLSCIDGLKALDGEFKKYMFRLPEGRQ